MRDARRRGCRSPPPRLRRPARSPCANANRLGSDECPGSLSRSSLPLLFGGMSVALGFSMRRSRDALVGAFATAFSGFCVCAVVALVGREWGGELWPFVIAGLLAPGGAQLLFVLGVREAGPCTGVGDRRRGAAGRGDDRDPGTRRADARCRCVAGAVLIVGRRPRARRRARPPGALPGDRARVRLRLHRPLRDPRQRRPAHRVGQHRRPAARRVGDDPLRDGDHLRRARGRAPEPRLPRTSGAKGPPSCCRASSGARRTRSSSRPSTARACRSSARWWRRSRSSRSCWRCFSCAARSSSAGISCSVQALVVAGGALIGAFR